MVRNPKPQRSIGILTDADPGANHDLRLGYPINKPQSGTENTDSIQAQVHPQGGPEIPGPCASRYSGSKPRRSSARGMPWMTSPARSKHP